MTDERELTSKYDFEVRAAHLMTVDEAKKMCRRINTAASKLQPADWALEDPPIFFYLSLGEVGRLGFDAADHLRIYFEANYSEGEWSDYIGALEENVEMIVSETEGVCFNEKIK